MIDGEAVIARSVQPACEGSAPVMAGRVANKSPIITGGDRESAGDRVACGRGREGDRRDYNTEGGEHSNTAKKTIKEAAGPTAALCGRRLETEGCRRAGCPQVSRLMDGRLRIQERAPHQKATRR